MAEKIINVSADALRVAARDIFIAAGLSPEHAGIVSDSLVEADLRGVHSHGAMRIGQYLPQIAAGAINPAPHIRVVRDSGATALIDGDAGMGQIAGTIAMKTAIAKAAASGIGAVGVRNSSHFGAAGYYSEMALAHDMIGFASTNCGPSLPAPGGAQRVVGNNPLSYALPAGEEPPIVLDMATSVIAGGKLLLAAAAGEKIPLGWALDGDGNPTDDPTEALTRGMFMPIGGAKGYGLAVVLDVLCGIMTGEAYGPHLGEQNDPTRSEDAGHFFIAIQIARFVPIEEFKARTDQMIREIRASKRAGGVERIYLPGEIEWEKKKRRLTGGIPLPAGVITQLHEAANQIGIAVTL